MMKSNKYLKGQSLFEVMIAMGISALVIVTLVSLVNTSILNATVSRNKTIASRLAQEATEWLRRERDGDINVFKEKVVQSSVWCIKDLTWTFVGSCLEGSFVTGTQFVRELKFTTQTVSGKNIIGADIVVSWIDPSGLHEVSSATNFADWRER